MGIAGVLCIWFRGDFWLAVVIIRSMFLLGAGFIHIKELVINKNRNIGNAGSVLYMDFIMPILLWILMIIYLTAPSHSS
jgi:hypothetical protein